MNLVIRAIARPFVIFWIQHVIRDDLSYRESLIRNRYFDDAVKVDRDIETARVRLIRWSAL